MDSQINKSFALNRFHNLLNSTCYFTLLFSKLILNHTRNWTFDISIWHISDSCSVLINFLQNISTNNNFSTNNLLISGIRIIAWLCTQINLIFWLKNFKSYWNKLSVWHWPWGAVSHVCDFKVAFLIKNLVINTCGVKLLKNAWCQ